MLKMGHCRRMKRTAKGRQAWQVSSASGVLFTMDVELCLGTYQHVSGVAGSDTENAVCIHSPRSAPNCTNYAITAGTGRPTRTAVPACKAGLPLTGMEV